MPFGFNQADTNSILELIDKTGDQQIASRRSPLVRSSGVWMMEATTAITAATTTIPGTGTAKLKWRNLDTGTFEDWEPNGVIVTQTVYTMTVPVASGWLFQGIQDNFGTIYVDRILNATEYTGLINDASGFAATDATTAMDVLTAVNGVPVETALATVHNYQSWPGNDNAPARARWNSGLARWELVMVDCQ
mgnify:CR=1 FL=1